MIGRRALLGSILAAAGSPALAATPESRTATTGSTLAPQAGVMTAAFQAALNAASLKNQPLLLGSGSYRIGSVRLPANTRIIGVPGATRLILDGIGPILWTDRVNSVHLRHLLIDGRLVPVGAGRGLVTLKGVADVAVEDCIFVRSLANGLHLDGCGGRVERSRMTSAADAGLFAIDSTGLAIESNMVDHCGNGGILVWRSAPGPDSTIIRGNRISAIRADGGGTGQNGNGINVFRADNVMVSGNHMTGCAFTAVRCNSASNVQITDNQCFSSGETALYAEFAFQGAVITGNLVDRAALGISVVNFDSGGRLAVVRGNLVRNLKTSAPYQPDILPFGNGIAVEADATVSNNVIEGAPNLGLMLGFGPFLRDITATDNVIRSVGVGIAVSVVENAGPAIIANNMIRSARRGAIVGYRHATPSTPDMIGGAGQYSHLTITGNRSEA